MHTPTDLLARTVPPQGEDFWAVACHAAMKYGKRRDVGAWPSSDHQIHAKRFLLDALIAGLDPNDDLAIFLAAYRKAERIADRGHGYDESDADALFNCSEAIGEAAQRIAGTWDELADWIGSDE